MNRATTASVRRCLATEARQPKGRLRFDPTAPLTFRESLRIERDREAAKEAAREQVRHRRSPSTVFELIGAGDQALQDASTAVPRFRDFLADKGRAPLRRRAPRVLQINIGASGLPAGWEAVADGRGEQASCAT